MFYIVPNKVNSSQFIQSLLFERVLYRRHAHLQIRFYTDVDCTSNVDDWRLLAIVPMLGEKKQIASSTKVEYKAITHIACEMTCLHSLKRILSLSYEESMIVR